MTKRSVTSFLLVLCTVLMLAPVPTFARSGMQGIRPSSIEPFAGETETPVEPTIQAELPEQTAPQQQQMIAPTMGQEYVLGTGDRIRLTVYGEKDLSGTYEVSSTGVIALPLIGDVKAAGQPIRLFEQAVRQKLAQGYLRDPRVNAQVVNYRPFFILGEVAKPGSYPYVNGMSLLNAIALAGGYTYRADKDDVTITHANDPHKQAVKVPETALVLPGDIIRVPERFF